MSVSLKKGQKISLTKESAGLSKVIIGLGWDEAKQAKFRLFAPKQANIDCDASALVLQNGRLVSNDDIVYFKNLHHKTGTVQHMGDNLTGAGAGDDEQIIVDLAKIPSQYDKIVVVVNIYQATARNQHFGMIKNAFIRIIDARNNTEICKYNLTDDYSGMKAMIFGEVYRHNGEWKFNAIGQGTQDDALSQLSSRFV
ncbi:MAG: TerD family protein [Lachnospiraceae bacterium]|nr:TerD family protein [Lachnospiraceae bacterium]